MEKNMEFTKARALLMTQVTPVNPEKVTLKESMGMVLAEDILAAENVPPFDRSPYDGYTFRAADTQEASPEHPIVLTVLEEVPAGAVPTKPVTEGTATKILTGAPIPDGADAVIMYEKTEFTETQVKLFSPVMSGSNIVRAGEDVQKGQLLARKGSMIDVGTVGILASQGIAQPPVYRRPHIGLISTGNEVVEVGESLPAGKIYNSNRYTIEAILKKIGCVTEYVGIAGDCTEDIAASIAEGVEKWDAILLTGGVSAGDYDLTPAAMEMAGVELLVRGIKLKPGMACAFGTKDGKLVCGLSGNPAAAIAALQLVVLPALKKLCGRTDMIPPEITVTLADGYPKKSKQVRLLHGKSEFSDGIVKMYLPKEQGNVIISSMVGCDIAAIVPAGSDALEKGTILKGFML